MSQVHQPAPLLFVILTLLLPACATTTGDRQPAIVSQIRDSAQAHFDLREPLTREQVGIKDYPPYDSIIIDRQGGPLLDVRLTLTDDVTFAIDAFEIAFLTDARERAGPPKRVLVNVRYTSLADAEGILRDAQQTVLLPEDSVERRLTDIRRNSTNGVSLASAPVGNWIAEVEVRPNKRDRGTGLLSFLFYAVDSPIYRNIIGPELAERTASPLSPLGK